jgi:hypothetical protein
MNFDECNFNFRSKQFTAYLAGVQVARLVDADFDQFLSILPLVEKACEKTPEQKEAEAEAEIASIDAKILELQAVKAEKMNSIPEVSAAIKAGQTGIDSFRTANALAPKFTKVEPVKEEKLLPKDVPQG